MPPTERAPERDGRDPPSILVVEDEMLLAEELRDRLERLRYRVLGPARTPADALAWTERERPDLVLMDISLHNGSDGIAVAHDLRSRVDVPVVYLTAHADDATVVRAAATHPGGYLLKPVSDHELAITVSMALTRHQLETRLRESEARWATTLASLGDGVITADGHGRVSYLNPHAETLTGWPAAEAAGQPTPAVFSLRHEDTGAPVACPMESTIASGAPGSIPPRTVLVRRDGALTPVGDSVAPLAIADRARRGAVVIFRDEGPRRAAASRLAAAEERLRDAHALEALGRLAGGVAHDINNLMTVVIGCASMLEEALADDAACSPYARDIRQAGARSSDMARRLLAFSRRQPLHPAQLELAGLVTSMTPLLSRLLREDIRIEVAPSAGACVIHADRALVEEIIVQLAANARDAMPGGGRLTLACAAVDGDGLAPALEGQRGRYVRLSVSDTGVGMDDTTRRRLFEPFFTTRESGQGLGLAAVYGSVVQSGGHLHVSSEPGRGATFEIYFPAAAAAAAADR